MADIIKQFIRQPNLMSGVGSIMNGLQGSQSSGGSVNSAQNSSQSVSDSWANTAGAQASKASEQAAQIAFERQKELMQMQMDYNREEAQKARDWEEQMANTIYTRSVNNMREAGINPVLAAGMGLSGASVGSGQTASIGGATAPMANTFSEMNSGSHAESYGEGESHGNSWNQSTAGLATGLEQMGALIAGLLGGLNSSHTINIALDGLQETFGGNPFGYDENDTPEERNDKYRSTIKANNEQQTKGSKFLKWLNELQKKFTGVKI